MSAMGSPMGFEPGAIDPSMNGAPPPLMVPEEREVVAQRLLAGIRVMADKVATEENGAEAKDYANAAKLLADAYVVLDPELSVEGVPLAHQAAEAALDRAHKEELERVRAQQAAPAQKRRKLKMTKTAGGGTDYEMEG